MATFQGFHQRELKVVDKVDCHGCIEMEIGVEGDRTQYVELDARNRRKLLVHLAKLELEEEA